MSAESPKFMFLLCSERSGSNLITRMLGGHPVVCSPSPTHLIRILCENRPRYGDLRIDGNWHTLLDDAVALFVTKLGAWYTELDFDQLVSEVPERSIVGLLRYIFSREAVACSKSVLFIKENHIYRYLPLLLTAFSDLKILYQVRDPRDMALSWKRSAVLRGCVYRAARTWKTDQEYGISTLGYLSEQGKIRCLKYESLVSDAAAVLPGICEFIGIKFDPAMLDFHKAANTREDADCAADWKNIATPVMKNNFGKFREGLSQDEIACVETICDIEMRYFGYPRESAAVSDVAALEARVKQLELWDKPGYAAISEKERQIRARRSRVLERIQARPLQGIGGDV